MKRAIDVLGAAGGLLLLSPLLAVIAVLVKLSSPGPVFFRQQRMGRGMQPFWILKFRTMVQDAESRGRQITIGDDDRITSVGRWLRKAKLDELPQLINVLKGEMSLVGPRPEVPRYVHMFPDDFREVLTVRPGITDPASITFRDEAAVLAAAGDPDAEYVQRILPQKLRLAKDYVRRSSVRHDLSLVRQTLLRLVTDRLPDRRREAPQPALLKPAAVPFFRVALSDDEIGEVVACLRSGWLTTGERVRRFESDLADFVGAKHAVAVNSCTAALHLAVEALNLGPGQAVLVPTMTFAATAEVVRYQGAVPLLVDCDPLTGNIDLDDAARKISDLRCGQTPLDPSLKVVGLIPVHVAGAMVDMTAVRRFAEKHGLWVVEDAAHALPAAYRADESQPWRRCGENTAAVTCFSFYANKTITTGEGGMAVTGDAELAARMRQMSLHGLSHDAWKRYTGGGSWDYRIEAPGYKYNLTDIAAAIGLHQLRRAETLRLRREDLAHRYLAALAGVDELELPPVPENRLHSWHLFPIRLRLDELTLDRNGFIDELRSRGVGCSVHWRPLHLHPYYERTFGWRPEDLPTASRIWERLISLPLFPDLQEAEWQHVVTCVRGLCERHKRSGTPIIRRKAA